MPNAELSRWTLSWFAAALFFLAAALVLILFGAGGPGRWSEGSGFAVIHCIALGWLSQMMLGALLQFAPVLAARPLAFSCLALPALLALSTGTATLVAGFQFSGDAAAFLLPGAAGLLGIAFGLSLIMLVPTLAKSASLRSSEPQLILLALGLIIFVWVSGATMALTRSGTSVSLGEKLLTDREPLHIILGLGGWLTLAAFGVSYKLFPMFLVAPEKDGLLRKAGLGVAGLAAGIGAGALVLLAFDYAPPLPLLGLLSALAVILHFAETCRIWRSRRRKIAEVNMRHSLIAHLFLLAGLALLPLAITEGGPFAEATVFILLAGWLSTLTLAQIGKIVAFMTWIEIFAPHIGRSAVPMVGDLSSARTSDFLLWLWSFGAVLGGISHVIQSPSLFRVAAIPLLLAALGLCVELWRIRRLLNLPPQSRPPRLPPVFLPRPNWSKIRESA